MHSRSNRRGRPDMDVGKKSTYFKTDDFGIIKEKESEDLEEVKKENIQCVFETKKHFKKWK